MEKRRVSQVLKICTPVHAREERCRCNAERPGDLLLGHSALRMTSLRIPGENAKDLHGANPTIRDTVTPWGRNFLGGWGACPNSG